MSEVPRKWRYSRLYVRLALSTPFDALSAKRVPSAFIPGMNLIEHLLFMYMCPINQWTEIFDHLHLSNQPQLRIVSRHLDVLMSPNDMAAFS